MEKSGKKKSILIIKWLFSYLNPYRGWLVLCIFSTIILLLFSVVKIHFIRILIESLIQTKDFNIAYFLIIFSIILLIIVIASFGKRYTSGKISSFATRDIQNKYTEHIMSLTVEDLTNRHSGDISSRMMNDISMIKIFLGDGAVSLFLYPMQLLICMIYMISLNWFLTLVSFSLVPVFVFATSLLGNKVRTLFKDNFKYLGEGNIIVSETIRNASVVKTFHLGDILFREAKKYFELSRDQWYKIHKVFSPMLALIIFSRELPRIVCFLAGGYMALNEMLSIAVLIAFTQIIEILVEPIQNIHQLIAQIKSTAAAVERIEEILEIPHESIKGIEVVNTNTEVVVEFENAGFAYDNSNTVIKDLNFCLNKNEFVGLVGGSGCGKSTLLRLICGFYKLQQGNIKIFEQDISFLNLESLRQQIAYLSQENVLFSNTIRENIWYGHLEADYSEIQKAAKLSNAEEFITEMENGYDSFIGEQGAVLSGGQRQRISIARTLLKSSPILLFDEPTSDLDYYSDKLFQDLMNILSNEKSILVATHRISTIRHAHRILVMNQGRIVEEGTHEQLIVIDGYYKDMYENQEFDYRMNRV